MGFWITALVLVTIVAIPLLLALRRGVETTVPAADADIAVYRDQLKDIERDLARGVLPASEAERLKIEVSRRLLEADRQRGASDTAATRGPVWAAVAVVALALGAGVWTYGRIGAPAYADLSLADRIVTAEATRMTRPGQAEAEADAAQARANMPAPTPEARYVELVEKLRVAVAERPGDLQGQTLLAQSEAALGNFTAAHAAQARVIDLKGDAATAMDYAGLADLMILATGGYVSPEAERALNAALERDPDSGTAIYYLGLMYGQTGRPDITFGLWRRLLEQGPQDAPWVTPIRDQILDLAQIAGVRYQLPDMPAARGPDAAAVAAASEMSAEDRQAMITGMVAQLAERLDSGGGTAEEWARLVNAYGVLGETGKARDAWLSAQQLFADTPDALTVLRAAAEAAGVAE